jgi:hypothetical protein
VTQQQLPPRTELHTTEQAAAALGVRPGTIRQWKLRGQAAPAGVMRAGVPGGLQPLWRLAELEPLAEAYHARKQHRAPRRQAG